MAGPGRELGLLGHWAARTGLGRQVLWLESQWDGSGGRTVNRQLPYSPGKPGWLRAANLYTCSLFKTIF